MTTYQACSWGCRWPTRTSTAYWHPRGPNFSVYILPFVVVLVQLFIVASVEVATRWWASHGHSPPRGVLAHIVQR